MDPAFTAFIYVLKGDGMCATDGKLLLCRVCGLMFDCCWGLLCSAHVSFRSVSARFTRDNKTTTICNVLRAVTVGLANKQVKRGQIGVLSTGGDSVRVTASTTAGAGGVQFVLIGGQPLNEPIVQYGPVCPAVSSLFVCVFLSLFLLSSFTLCIFLLFLSLFGFRVVADLVFGLRSSS